MKEMKIPLRGNRDLNNLVTRQVGVLDLSPAVGLEVVEEPAGTLSASCV